MKQLYFIFLLSYFTANAQQWDWTKNIGYSSIIANPLVKADAHGNVFTANTSGYDPQNSRVTKRNADGNVLWSRAINGWNTYLVNMSIDNNGSTYIFGFFAWNLVFSDTILWNNGDWESFIVCYDTNGNRRWVKFLDQQCNCGNFLANDNQNNLICAGQSTGGNWIVSKITSTGHTLWYRTYSSTASINGVETDVLNNIYLYGDFAGAMVIDGHTYRPLVDDAFYRKGHVTKLNLSGIVQEVHVIMGTDIRDLHIDVNNNMYLFGTYDTVMQIGSFHFTVDTCYQYSCTERFIAKLDNNYNCVWAKKISDFFFISKEGLAVAGNGRVFLTGRAVDTVSIDNITVTQTGPFVFGFDTNGNVEWAAEGYPQADNTPSGIAFSESGVIYIAGDGYSFSFLSKLSPPEFSISEPIHSNNGFRFSIFPNPNEGIFTIQPSSTVEMKIYNNVGTIIYRQLLTSPTQQIDLSLQPKGIYFLEAGNERRKIVLD